MKRNLDTVNLQMSFLNKSNLPELVKHKRRLNTFFKVIIISFFLIIAASLLFIFKDALTNKDSRGFTTSEQQILVSSPDYQKRIYG